MATPTFDARKGLSQGVLKDLRQADRVSVAFKNRQTAILGYWIKLQSPSGEEVNDLRAVLLPASVPEGLDEDLRANCPVIIDMARGMSAWRKVVEPLQPGDILTVDWNNVEHRGLASAPIVLSPLGWPQDEPSNMDRGDRPIDPAGPVPDAHFVGEARTSEVRLRRGSSTLMILRLHHPAA